MRDKEKFEQGMSEDPQRKKDPCSQSRYSDDASDHEGVLICDLGRETVGKATSSMLYSPP